MRFPGERPSGSAIPSPICGSRSSPWAPERRTARALLPVLRRLAAARPSCLQGDIRSPAPVGSQWRASEDGGFSKPPVAGVICLLWCGKGHTRKLGLLAWRWYVDSKGGKTGGSQCSKSSLFGGVLVSFLLPFRHTWKLGLHAFKLISNVTFGFSFFSPKNLCCYPEAHLGTQFIATQLGSIRLQRPPPLSLWPARLRCPRLPREAGTGSNCPSTEPCCQTRRQEGRGRIRTSAEGGGAK